MIAALAAIAITLGATTLYFRGKAAAQAEALRELKSLASSTAAELDGVKVRFAPVLDLDAEEHRLREAIAQLEVERHRAAAQAEKEKRDLSSRYADALSTFERLRSEVALLEENVEDLSFGLYKPHFDFQSSEEFKAAIEAARKRQRDLVHSGSAVSCPEEWTVGGSRREGQRMAKQYMKLILRAFNAEADAAIASVAWNNVTKMEERIRKSFDALNALGTVVRVELSSAYMNAKLDELRLVFEHEDKRRAEREEQRRIREQIREEERAQRELAKAQEEAAKEEARLPEGSGPRPRRSGERLRR